MKLLQWLFHRKQAELDLADEFRFHLQQQVEDGISRGLSPEEAHAAAMRALDRIELRKEECRDASGFAWFEGVMQDLRYAIRVLRKSPAFTTVAILSLALGIGANTAIFSVMDVLLLRPLHVPQPERLQLVSLQMKAGAPRSSLNYQMFELIRDRNSAFSRTFAWTIVKFQIPDGSDMLLIPGAYASGDYFSALGVAPELGRTFGHEDDQPSGGRNGAVALISDAFWLTRYQRNPSILGKALTLNGAAVTVIGVMPHGFFGTEVGTAPDVWVPLNLQRQLEDPKCISSPGCWYLRVMGRLKDGISEQQAGANLRTISRQVMEDNRPPTRADQRADFLSRVIQIEPGVSGYTGLRRLLRAPLQVLMALVGFVLLIACANMANLLTARASARHKEVAVRLAMGAGRARVIRQFLTESLLLAVAGAMGGFVVAIWATRSLITLVSSTAVLDLRPDWRVLLFTCVAAVFTGLLFGLAPALRATKMGVATALKERTHQMQGTGGSFGFTRVLLGLQVALSVVLLAAAGLLAGSLVRLLTESPGFDVQGVTVAEIDTRKLPQKGDALMGLYGRIMERARSLPGVESASLMSTTPLADSGWDEPLTIPGRTDIPEDRRDTAINAVGPGLLATMRIPLRAGRDFTDGDTAQSAKVAILSESAAKEWFPNGAIGADIGLAKSTLRIVGIAGDTKYWNLRDRVPPTIFIPYTQWNQTGFIAMRTHAPLNQTYGMFRDMLRQAAPGAPIRTIRTMQQSVDQSLSTERLTAYLSVFFAVLALLLTAIGLYGILAYSVTRRTSEIGVRMALGAQRGGVIWLFIREAMGHTVIGAVVGIAIVTLSSKLIVSLLYGVHPNDLSTMILAVASLAFVCAAAAWIPARRASRLDPMVALREE